MSNQRPAPLVPAEVDLRGLEYMPLLGARLYSSDFNLDASDTEFRVGLRLWWASWNQVPAGSLPSQDSRLCKLAGLEEAPAKWRKVRSMALHGFIECSDSRLYHPVIAEQALIAWEKRAEHVAEQQNSNERKRRDREDRRVMFEALRAVGVVPPWDTKKDDLRRLYAAHVTQPVTPPVTVTGSEPVTPPVTVTETARTGRDETGRNTTPTQGGEFSTTAAPPPSDPPAQAPGSDPGHGIDEPPLGPSLAGRACLACRGANVIDVNPSHPDLLRLLAAGVTPEEIGSTAAECAAKGRGRFAYVLATVERRRADAAAAPAVQAAAPGRRLTAAEQRVLQATPSLAAPHLRPSPATATETVEVIDVAARRLG